MKFKYIPVFVALFAVSFASCDFLEKEPSDRLVDEEFYKDEADLAALTGGLYNTAWFDFNRHFYHSVGDGFANNLWGPYDKYLAPFNNISDISSSGAVDEGWNSLYNVVNQASMMVKKINEYSASSIPDEVKNRYIGEARFMRGLAYWYLASCWGDVPIIEDNASIIMTPLVPKIKQEDVFKYAIADMEYAACTLPRTQNNAGRVTRYSALGMLSRFFLVYSGYKAAHDEQDPATYNQKYRDATYLNYAKMCAFAVIKISGLSLQQNYKDLFTTDNNNNSESLFALQWVPGVYAYGTSNTHQNWLGYSTAIVAGQVAEGSDIYASADMIKSYSNDDLRLHSTWFNYKDTYSEICKIYGGLTFDRTQNLSDMIYRANAKKGIVGSYEDNGVSYENNSGLNTYMLRLAEVYLNYAEASLANTTDVLTSRTDNGIHDTKVKKTPLDFFNEVYSRAHNGEKLTSVDMTTLLRERRLEFALEGRYWYDLLAWSYYDRSNTINYILGDQNRTYQYYYRTQEMRYEIDKTKTIGVVGVTSDNFNFLLPYPESEVTQNPYLSGDAISYPEIKTLEKQIASYESLLLNYYQTTIIGESGN
jgi:hypothetical protein